MASSAEQSSLFPIYILAMMALFLVPYTIHKLIHALSKKEKNTYCHCSVCFQSRKYHKTTLKRISSFCTCSNLTIVLLWFLMAFLGYYVKNINRENQAFEPFEVLGLKPGSSESEIKKAYRTLSRQYHPDKNPDPEAHKYFVEYITKAYQALTDPISRENFEKYGHPDGRQGFQIGIALPQFLLSTNGSSSGLILLVIVIVILFPLVIGVIYLSRSSSYSANSVMRQTLEDYYLSMKPFLAPSKVMEVFIKAAEYMEIPVRNTDSEMLHKLFTVVQTELGLDSKNTRQEQAKFWKRHPALTKAELLILAHLSRESVSIPLTLVDDFKHVIKLAPLLLEELLKMAIIRRPPARYGWLRPALGVLELSQNIVQAVPLSARKAVGGFAEGHAPLLQLPHFSEESAKKLSRKKLRSFQELRDMAPDERLEILTQIAGLSNEEAKDVETVLDIMPSLMVHINCETEGEEGGIQEGDIVTMQAWISLKRGNGLTAAIPHCPYFPFHKDENFWFFLADSASNDVWISQKVKFMDEKEAIASASNFIEESKEESGVDRREIDSTVKKVVEKLKSGSRLVMSKFEAPAEGTYNLTAYCMCDSWVGCDAKTDIKLKVTKQKHTSTNRGKMAEDRIVEDESSEEGEETEEEDDDYESEYSDDGENNKTTKKNGK